LELEGFRKAFKLNNLRVFPVSKTLKSDIWMKKSLILFDNDGVLVDTEKWYFEANRLAQQELGYKLDSLKYQNIMKHGTSSWDWLLEKGVSEEKIAKGKQRRNFHYNRFLQTKEITIANVEETLKLLKPFFKMAIVTTARKEDFNLIHKNRPLAGYMDAIFALGDYKRSKPYPDPYLKALEHFNESAKNAVVVEDTERGLLSAVAAGIDCIVVKNKFTSGQNFSKAKTIVKSITEIPSLIVPLKLE
jgi:HAD superfamily hydrolase (TIGR01509 family)